MDKIKKSKKVIDFQGYLAKQLKNKDIKKHYDEYGKQLEIAYKILELRKRLKMSQVDLANKIGTTQGNVARMESGEQNFTTDTLQKIAGAFNSDLKIEFIGR